MQEAPLGAARVQQVQEAVAAQQQALQSAPPPHPPSALRLQQVILPSLPSAAA